MTLQPGYQDGKGRRQNLWLLPIRVTMKSLIRNLKSLAKCSDSQKSGAGPPLFAKSHNCSHPQYTVGLSLCVRPAIFLTRSPTCHERSARERKIPAVRTPSRIHSHLYSTNPATRLHRHPAHIRLVLSSSSGNMKLPLLAPLLIRVVASATSFNQSAPEYNSTKCIS